MLTDNQNAPMILVVEDNDSHAELILHSFEESPTEFRLEHVASIKAAGTATEQRPPSLVLADYRLPDGPGSELVSMAAGLWPVIMMTSHGNEQLAVDAMKIGAQDYIVKSPEVFETLPHTVSLALKVWSLIQSRRRAEEKLRESEKKHRKLSNEYQIILNALPVGISLVKNRKVVWANPAHCRIFGYEVGSTYNMDTAALYADREIYDEIGAKGYSTIKSGGIFSQDLIMKKKDGSLIWCNLVGQSVTPGTLEDGSIWIVQDISERKRAEKERQQLEQQFHQAQKLESLGVLAGGIAHDFNNILTVIIGHCYMAREDIIPVEEYKEAFQKIENAGNRAANLCCQMLTYAGKSPLVQTRVNLWLLLDEVVKMLQAAIKKNVTIKLDLKRDIPEINGDTGQIQQIIMNLIINAAEAIGDKNGTIRVTLANQFFESDQSETDMFGAVIKAGGYACLEVADTGCGMDEETQKRIFEPFYTTKITGRGLGMSAIRGIIKSHEGILQLTSTPDVGTTFKVFFPIQAVSDYSQTTPAESAASEKTGGTILLVEDEATLRVMGTALLGALGFTAITASDGREALDIYRKRSSEIDVILMDLVMPVMGGIEAYHELREISPAVPIIICSGYGVESIAEVIENDQHAGFMHKPYKPSELRNLMVKMMMG